MRDVDDHSEVVELAHHLAAERRDAAAGRVALRRPDGCLPGPGELEVAQAEAIEGAQHAEIALDEARALAPEEQGGRAGAFRRDDVVGLEREHETAAAR